ncbi:unnamed protein product [Ambrosiozyma monospora]|uniref:Unnamed protein product n=1 Tax=Ambrosiozyma monospora TaxID=43982 RepID=A0ACB5TA15_AMBMO|nr:unnamed protein product [Ambrosiozyma monospora]
MPPNKTSKRKNNNNKKKKKNNNKKNNKSSVQKSRPASFQLTCLPCPLPSISWCSYSLGLHFDEPVDPTELIPLLPFIKTLGIHEISASCDTPSGNWCDLIPYAKELDLDNFRDLSSSWISKYADKITSLTVETYLLYLKNIMNSREKFKSLKQIYVPIEYYDHSPSTSDEESGDESDLERVKESLNDYSYIDSLLELSNHFDEVILTFSGSASQLLNPQLAKYYNHPKSRFSISYLNGTITKEAFSQSWMLMRFGHIVQPSRNLISVKYM